MKKRFIDQDTQITPWDIASSIGATPEECVFLCKKGEHLYNNDKQFRKAIRIPVSGVATLEAFMRQWLKASRERRGE